MHNNQRQGVDSRDDAEPLQELTIQQLESMAARQQNQIYAQQQMLLAKENRLDLLRKQQEQAHGRFSRGVRSNGQIPTATAAGQQQFASVNGFGVMVVEPSRLTALRQKIEQQEMKLRRLRMLRGQVTLGILSWSISVM
jgi:hypothetical protein